METCYFCRGRVVEKQIDHVHVWGDRLVLIEDVPAEVCEQCGEVYFSPEVLELMDRVTLEDVEPKETLAVPVYSLAKAGVAND